MLKCINEDGFFFFVAARAHDPQQASMEGLGLTPDQLLSLVEAAGDGGVVYVTTEGEEEPQREEVGQQVVIVEEEQREQQEEELNYVVAEEEVIESGQQQELDVAALLQAGVISAEEYAAITGSEPPLEALQVAPHDQSHVVLADGGELRLLQEAALLDREALEAEACDEESGQEALYFHLDNDAPLAAVGTPQPAAPPAATPAQSLRYFKLCSVCGKHCPKAQYLKVKSN